MFFLAILVDFCGGEKVEWQRTVVRCRSWVTALWLLWAQPPKVRTAP